MTRSVPVHVRTPDAGVGRRSTYLTALVRRRGLIAELSRAELESGHADTLLGRVWNVLNPVLLALVYLFLLTVLRVRAADPATAFAELLGALFVFYFTRNAVNLGLQSLVRGARLLHGAVFPRMVLPLASVVTAGRLLLPALAVYAVVHVAVGRPVTVALLAIPALLAAQALLNVGVVLALATWAVGVRDLSTLMPYVLRLWLYASPVLYRAEDLPEGLRWVLHVNPVGPLLAAVRAALDGRWPGLELLPGCVLWPLGALVVGAVVFWRREPYLGLHV